MCCPEPDDVQYDLSLYGCGQIIKLNDVVWYSLCLHRRQCCCQPFRRRGRTLLPYCRATQGWPKRRTFSEMVDNRRTILLYRLYYPLSVCVSRRIDTWQIVYLSHKEPCPTISIHKRYIHVPWPPMDNDGTTGKGARARFACTDGGALYCLIGGRHRAGLNDVLSQKWFDNRRTILRLPSVLSVVCIAQN